MYTSIKYMYISCVCHHYLIKTYTIRNVCLYKYIILS